MPPLIAIALLLSTSVPAAPDSLGEHRRLAAELAGTWAGTVTEAGDTQPIALAMTPDSSGALAVTLSFPVVHLDRIPLGTLAVSLAGDSLRLGTMRFGYDRARRELHGTMPAAWTPGRTIPLVLRPVDGFDFAERPPLGGEVRQPTWTYHGSAAMWAGPVYAGGVLVVGDDDGVVHLLDARRGEAHWTARTGGRIRTRPTVDRDAVYVHADDGMLYRLALADGRRVWSVPVDRVPIERRPPGDPRTRFDRFGSDVVVSGGRLWLGTHDGRVLALDPADGHTLWEARTGDAILAAPRVTPDRVFVGSLDGAVYAFAAQDGRALWKREVGGGVVSTPALDGDRLVVGTRGYDLLGLDADDGTVVWRRYVWMSWVESSPTIRDGVAYVGSSDAAIVAAVDARGGSRRWTADVQGWSWGQPAVTADRVFVTTSGRADAMVPFRPGVLALDRASGAVVWRYAPPPAVGGDDGWPGSPAIGDGMVFVSGYDGRVMAFRQ